MIGVPVCPACGAEVSAQMGDAHSPTGYVCAICCNRAAPHGPELTAPAFQTEPAGTVDNHDRANRLADQCGVLADECNNLIAENGRLRRELERLKTRRKS